jgi:Cysteine sulfinate desulfinase/cysteine desulfurase and related enzymes
MDNNATTQIDDQVALFMSENTCLYGNASSMHSLGRNSAAAIEWSRSEIAELLNCEKQGVYFTSGATESNNTVFNTFREEIDDGSKRNRIITTTIEHPAIIEMSHYLIKKGYKVEFAPVDKTGMVKVDVLSSMLGPDVALVSVMLGNNETGTIQPVAEISKLVHECGAYMHTDATQAIGKIPVDVKALGVDYLSLSGHKFYGPKGVGVLYVKPGCPFVPYIKGGHQEGGYRAGTYNNQAIIGIGKAAELARLGQKAEYDKLWSLRERLRKGIIAGVPEVVVNGNQDHCLPGTLNVSFPAAEGESILLYLDLEGIEVSTGSACASGSLEPSYVLLASGLPVELAHGSIRFSLGRFNSEEDIDYVISVLPGIIKKIRAMSTRKG